MKTKTKKKFDPTTFIGKGWTIASDNGFNPDTLDGIELTHFLKKDEKYITGNQILERMGDSETLNADAFLCLWENQELIPKSWYEPAQKGYIEFTGTVLRRSGGDRYFLYLCRRDDGSWYWLYDWLGRGRNRDRVSPLLASKSSGAKTLSSESLTLVSEIEERLAQLRKVLDK